MSAETLLPCPFCGCAEMLDHVESGGWTGIVHCDNCGAIGPYPQGETGDMSWNERAQTPKS